MTELAPFEQLPFEDLPQRPERPHDYEATEARETTVRSKAFGSVETHYRTYGSGPPLLLVHGLMTSSYSWRYVFRPLGEWFTLYAPDLPGAGRTEKPLGPTYSAEALARWLVKFRRSVGIDGASVVGNSLGGYLAMWLALLEPNSAPAVVNLHGPGLPTLRLRTVHWLGRLPGLPRLVAWVARRQPARWAHRHVHYYDESLKSREEAEAFGAPLSTVEGSRAFSKYLTEALDPAEMAQFVERLRRRRDRDEGFPSRLLLLYAERDPIVPPDIGRRLSELVPDAEYRTVVEASHFVQVDAPEECSERILAFLDSS